MDGFQIKFIAGCSIFVNLFFHLFWHYSPRTNYLFFGIETAELTQRNFSDIGFNNFTFHAGQRFDNDFPIKFGWSLLTYRVDLAKAHLMDTNTVIFIEGDRSTLSGDLSAFHLFFDGALCNLSFLKLGDRYLVRIIPEAGIGLNYGSGVLRKISPAMSIVLMP
jgi:hypothetical protein